MPYIDDDVFTELIRLMLDLRIDVNVLTRFLIEHHGLTIDTFRSHREELRARLDAQYGKVGEAQSDAMLELLRRYKGPVR